MKSYRRKFVVVPGVVISAAILLLAFLPTLVSTAPVRRFILQRVHSATGARVEVDEWSFSWRKPQQVDKILYHDDESGLHATVHRITVAHGLLTMLRDRNTGDIVLERPLLTIRLPEPEPLPTDPVPGEPAPVPDPEDPEPVAWLPFIPRLSCHDGSVIIESDQRLLAIGDLELLIEREPDPSTALNVRLSGRQLDTSGSMNVDIRLKPEKAADTPATALPPGVLAIQMAQWDLVPIGHVLRAIGQNATAKAWDISGMMTLDAKYQLQGEAYDVASLDFTVADFLLSANGRDLLADDQINLAGKTGLNLKDRRIEMDDGTATFSALGISGQLHFRNLLWDPGEAIPSGDLSLVLQSDLERLSPALTDIDDMQIAGQARLQGDVRLQNQQLQWDPFSLRLNDFLVSRHDLNYAATNLVLQTRGKAELATHHLEITRFSADGLPGNMQGEIRIADWNLLPAGLAVQTDARLSIEDLLDALQGTAAVEPLAGAGGIITASIEIARPTGSTAWELNIDSETESLALPLSNGNILREDRLMLAADAMVDDDGKISFAPLSFDTSALGLTASGNLDKIDERMRLQCDGMLRYDLDALTQRAAEWQMTLPVTAHGSAERPFTIHMPLDNAWLQDGTVSASIAIERLEGYGLRSDSLDIPLTLQDGVASAIIATGIHEGNIDLRPRLQSMDERLVLTLPADATVLHKIPLTDELANDLLSIIHPAFSGAVATSGTVDLESAEFYLPLAADADHEIVFRGTLQLRDVTLEAADVLDRARSLARIPEAVYRIDDQDIRFVCADGRVETSPLQLRIEGHQITLSGSMGLDETLDYTIRTPVTQRLVGRDVYNYLRDATINIPVRGTVSRPQLGEEEVREAVADLIRQAGRRAIERGAQDLLRQFLE